jgi:delta8-fatty-acid desaturase
MSRHQIISPEEIKRRVAEGEPIVIYEGYVLHLGEWIDMHPGGRLSILHMVGRDATDEINMLVTPNALRLAVDCYLRSSQSRKSSPRRCRCG